MSIHFFWYVFFYYWTLFQAGSEPSELGLGVCLPQKQAVCSCSQQLLISTPPWHINHNIVATVQKRQPREAEIM
jgi:hypothetical protein